MSDPFEELHSVLTSQTEALNNVAARIDGLSKYGRRNRILIRILAISVVFDVLLSLCLGFVAYQAHEASSRTRLNASAQTVACQSGNQARAAQTDLWNFIFSTENKATETPEQRATVAKLHTIIDTAFAQRDCDPHAPTTTTVVPPTTIVSPPTTG